MRILDDETSKSLSTVTLFLTISEARELRDKVESLIASTDVHHEHVPSEDYQKEITVTIYEGRPIESFDDRSRRLILEDI